MLTELQTGCSLAPSGWCHQELAPSKWGHQSSKARPAYAGVHALKFNADNHKDTCWKPDSTAGFGHMVGWHNASPLAQLQGAAHICTHFWEIQANQLNPLIC
jgi:hypothetical protein